MSLTTNDRGFFSRLIGAASVIARGSDTLSLQQVMQFFRRGSGAGDRPTRPYSQVSAVYACVRARAQAISSMPLMISTTDDQVLESGPLVDMAERPNPAMTQRAFWLATSSILDLFGKVHWVMTIDSLQRPYHIVPVMPVQMRATTDFEGNVQQWKYRPAGAKSGFELTLAPEEVHTIIDPDFEDAANPLKGLSPRVAVALAISQCYKSDVANESILDNDVAPSGMFTTDGHPTETQIDDLKSQLNERKGAGNRARAMVLYGGMSWTQMGSAFKDMEFSVLKKMAREDICAGYSVPPAILGFFIDSNYGAANAAKEHFYESTILPLAARLAEEWDLAIVSKYESDQSLRATNADRRGIDIRQRCSHGFITSKRGAHSRRRLFPWFDSSGVQAVQRAKLGQIQQGKTLWDMGTPLNHIYQAFDLPLPEVEYGNVGYKPIGLEAYGSDMFADIDDAPPENELLPVDDAPAQPGDKGHRIARDASDVQATLRATESLRRRLYAMWRKSWRSLEKKGNRQLKNHFWQLRQAVLTNFDSVSNDLQAMIEGKSFTPDERRTLIAQILFNLETANGSIKVKLGQVMKGAMLLGGEQSMQEAADAKGQEKADPFRIADQTVKQRLAARNIRLQGVNKTLRQRLAKKLSEAVDEGQGITEIANMLKAEFNFASKRAAVIAHTEIGAAVEEARDIGRKQAGVPLKSWLSSGKATGRSAHTATEAATTASPIAADDLFTIVGTSYTCQHPRDASLPPGETVNCSCTTLSRYPDDSIKSMLGRYAAKGFLTYETLMQRDMRAPHKGKDADDGQE